MSVLNETTIYKNSHQSGHSLVEVMVSLMILSIGLLGLAGLQVSGVANTKSAYMRSQAVMIAYDIVDRMRANPDGVNANLYDSIDTNTTAPTSPGCINTGCTSTQLATQDIVDWYVYFKGRSGDTTIEPLLPPGARGQVSKSGDVFTVTVDWSELNQEGQSENQQFTVSFSL